MAAWSMRSSSGSSHCACDGAYLEWVASTSMRSPAASIAATSRLSVGWSACTTTSTSPGANASYSWSYIGPPTSATRSVTTPPPPPGSRSGPRSVRREIDREHSCVLVVLALGNGDGDLTVGIGRELLEDAGAGAEPEAGAGAEHRDPLDAANREPAHGDRVVGTHQADHVDALAAPRRRSVELPGLEPGLGVVDRGVVIGHPRGHCVESFDLLGGSAPSPRGLTLSSRFPPRPAVSHNACTIARALL